MTLPITWGRVETSVRVGSVPLSPWVERRCVSSWSRPSGRTSVHSSLVLPPGPRMIIHRKVFLQDLPPSSYCFVSNCFVICRRDSLSSVGTLWPQHQHPGLSLWAATESSGTGSYDIITPRFTDCRPGPLRTCKVCCPSWLPPPFNPVHTTTYGLLTESPCETKTSHHIRKSGAD